MAILNSNVSTTGLVEKYIGTAYDHVKNVSENMDSVVKLAAIDDIEAIADIIAPAVDDAEAAAAAALISEENAAISANGSANSALQSSTSASESATSATAASGSANAALQSELNASISEQNAENSAQDSSGHADRAMVYRDCAYLWSSEEEDIPVTDGTHNGFSAYHWAQKAEDVAAAGQDNTASNLGTGEGLYSGKVLVDLQFKSLIVTGSSTISSDADSITIDTVNNLDHSNLTNTASPDSHPIGSITSLQSSLDNKAPLFSPNFTGVPTAPTVILGDSSLKIATTQFVTVTMAGKADVTYVDDQIAIAIALG